MAPAGLTLQQQALFLLMEGGGPMTAAEVSEVMGWTMGASLRVLQSLATPGLVTAAIVPGSSLWWVRPNYREVPGSDGIGL